MRLNLLTVLATTLAAVGVTAPNAAATHQLVACRMRAASHAPTTGRDTWEGHAQGSIVGNVGEVVTIRCVVKVYGIVRAATAWGAGTTTAATAGRVRYVSTETQVQQLCAQYTNAHGSGEKCFWTGTTEVPPTEVRDAAEAVIRAANTPVCAELAKLVGGYGLAEIKPDGDTYVNGSLVWDCPPYGYDRPSDSVDPVFVTLADP